MELLLQAEEEQRRKSRFERLLKSLRLRYQVSIEEINFDPARKLDKSLITDLATCSYFAKGGSLLIMGRCVTLFL